VIGSGSAPQDATVVVTGMGAFCAAGADVDSLWAALREGRTGIRRVQRFDTSPFSGPFAGEVPWDPADHLPPRTDVSDRMVAFALVAAREAWQRAGLRGTGVPPERCALVVGTSSGGHAVNDLTDDEIRQDPLGTAEKKARSFHWVVAVVVGAHLGLLGPRLTVSSACSSGTLALGLGRDLLQMGQADVVLVGGADAMFPQKYAGFHALGAIAPGPCAPFSEPVGMNLGEGAGFLVLERAGHAAARGAAELARMVGYGLSADAYHPTSPDPGGRGIARSIEGALRDAGLSPEAVDHYNAHATGTELNDPAEWAAVQRVFRERASEMAVNGPKSFLGHAFGAAGTLESIATVLALVHQEVPPTLHFRGPRPNGPVDPVVGERARPARVEVALCNNSAFGGANATVAFALPGAASPRLHRRPVYLAGVGIVGAQGPADPLEVLEAGHPLGRPVKREEEVFVAGRPPDRIEREVRSVDPRDLDPSATWLTLAAARALRDAHVDVSGAKADRAGLFVGTCRRPHRAHADFRRSYTRRGLGRASASAFARTVMNAASGAAARALSLRGMNATFAVGPGCGLYAVASAAHVLETRPDVEVLVAGGFDELDLDVLGVDPERPEVLAGPSSGFHGEGAACVVLSASPAPTRLAGWGLGGPGALDEAIARALGRAPGPIDGVFSSAAGPGGREREVRALRAALGDALPRVWPGPGDVLGYGPAFSAPAALAWAVLALRTGRLGGGNLARALVVCEDPDIGGCAVVIEHRRSDP